jgi:hypothetical protein
MEESPEVPASRERGGKDERARAVVTPNALSAEGRLRRAGWRCGDDGFATVGNVANPRIGSGTKQARAVEEEQAVEVVRNHADGTWEGVATLSEGRESAWEWTLRPMSVEGRSLDNPKRGNPMVYPTVGSQGPGRAGQDGTKVRRVAHPPMQVEECGPVEGPSRARACKRLKAVEGGGEGQRSHDFDRVFPPREASRRCGCRARTLQRHTPAWWQAASAARQRAPW